MQTIPDELILRLACSSVWGRYQKSAFESSEDMNLQEQDKGTVCKRRTERKEDGSRKQVVRGDIDTHNEKSQQEGPGISRLQHER